ncbi:MAG: uracil-xanthine permease [Clostridia bacterium]|nr:uracil-xanthine permease [Clostridia bacterium]
MKLYYDIQDKPKFPQLIIYAIQQLLAIMAATLVVPLIIGHDMQPSAALFGAGVGTLIYQLFTRGKSPVFLGSSFAFIGSMSAAFAGGVSAALGYAGIILGAVFAGLVYVVIALLVKFVGVNWIDKLMPKQVIGPTVAIIGLSLAANAIGDLQKGDVNTLVEIEGEMASQMLTNPLIAVLCGLVALFVTMICSTYGKKSIKLIPFIIGILSGYALAAVFTVIGNSAGIDALKVIDFGVFSQMSLFEIPNFTFLTAIDGIKEINASYIGTIAMAYLPVAFVVFAEHIADHKNISSIIEKDLLKEPGLDKTLLGDGVGSMFGAFFGGCPNTTYGESVACVAITRNASVATIRAAAIGAILISFFSPFVAFVDSIPACVMGGVCMALYGFIAVSGLKMIQSVDLEDNRNLFTVSVILISGIGGLTLSFGKITITAVACALILGIITNLVLGKKKA